MFTVRSYRNEDLSRLLLIWNKNREFSDRNHFFPIDEASLNLGPLNFLFTDRHSLKIAMDGILPVGFAQCFFGPNEDKTRLSTKSGQIGFVGINPDCSEPLAVGKSLIKECERYLVENGAEEIYGGSPHPSSPHYMSLYGGSEPVGFFHSDRHVVEAFRQSGYRPHLNTIRFQLNLKDYVPSFFLRNLELSSQVKVELEDFPHDSPKMYDAFFAPPKEFFTPPPPNTWWKTCRLARFRYVETKGILRASGQVIARLLFPFFSPSGEHANGSGSPSTTNLIASLIDIVVHPQYRRRGIAAYVLGESLKMLKEHGVDRIESHVSEGHAELFPLLRSLIWDEVETGTLFLKTQPFDLS